MDGQMAKEALELTSYSGTFLILVLGIMVTSGILAGLTNYFFSENQKTQGLQAILGRCLLGIVAALTVPLFLNIISAICWSQHKRIRSIYWSLTASVLFSPLSCAGLKRLYLLNNHKKSTKKKKTIPLSFLLKQNMVSKRLNGNF